MLGRMKANIHIFRTSSVLALLFVSGLPVTGLAQTQPSASKIAEQAQKRVEDNMVKMTDLSEALANTFGQLHYLRRLCFGRDDQKWRTKAAEMMRIEAGNDGAYHRQLIRAFNAGYYMQKDRYQTCTKAVAIDVAALAENGRRLSVMLGDPYRGVE